MDRKRLLYTLAGLGGVAAWLIFVLACTGGPAWSPDNSKIMFTWAGPKPDEKDTGVALYDRAGGTATSLIRIKSFAAKGVLPEAQFTRDGKRVIITMARDESHTPEVMLQSLDGRGPALHVVLPETKELSVAPYPEVGGNLFLGFEYIARLNITTGEVTIRNLVDGEAINLLPAGDRILFVRPKAKHSENEDTVLQFGELDPGDLSLKPFFEFGDKDQKKLNLDNFDAPGLISEPGGNRLLATACEDDKPVLVLFNRTGLERIVHPEFSAGCDLAGVAWSPDRKNVYIALLTPSVGGARQTVAVAEVPLSGGPARLDTVLALGKLQNTDVLGPALRLSISPDGQTLAISTGFLPPHALLTEQDRGLFLIDLADSARKVTRIPVPGLPGAQAVSPQGNKP